MARLVDLFAPGSFVGIRKFDFQVFADMYGADAFVAHLFEGALDGLALRIEHGLFRSNDNFGFHFKLTAPCQRHGPMLGKATAMSKPECSVVLALDYCVGGLSQFWKSSFARVRL